MKSSNTSAIDSENQISTVALNSSIELIFSTTTQYPDSERNKDIGTFHENDSYNYRKSGK